VALGAPVARATASGSGAARSRAAPQGSAVGTTRTRRTRCDPGSDPTLEEACEDYCEAAREAGCGETLPAECTTGCDQLREQLQGRCIDEYTDALDCTADGDFSCYNGVPIPIDTGCSGEAQDLAECLGVLD
jgi:hypothetical protein